MSPITEQNYLRTMKDEPISSVQFGAFVIGTGRRMLLAEAVELQSPTSSPAEAVAHRRTMAAPKPYVKREMMPLAEGALRVPILA